MFIVLAVGIKNASEGLCANSELIVDCSRDDVFDALFYNPLNVFIEGF